jgi:hypothetical protein
MRLIPVSKVELDVSTENGFATTTATHGWPPDFKDEWVQTDIKITRQSFDLPLVLSSQQEKLIERSLPPAAGQRGRCLALMLSYNTSQASSKFYSTTS